MLQSDVRIDEIKLAAGKYAEIASLVVQIFAAPAMFIVGSCVVDHCARDVDAIDAIEVERQGLGEAADAAPEIKREFFRGERMEGFDVVEGGIDLGYAGLEKLAGVPAGVPFFRMREDGPKGIGFAEKIPVLLKESKVQS